MDLYEIIWLCIGGLTVIVGLVADAEQRQDIERLKDRLHKEK